MREALYEDKEGLLLKNCVAIGGATGSGKGLILDAYQHGARKLWIWKVWLLIEVLY